MPELKYPHEMNTMDSQIQLKSLLVTTYIPALLLQMLRERGADPEAMLCDTGITQAQLCDPDHALTYRQVTTLICHGLEFTGDPQLGLQLGARIRPSHMAEFGMAISSTETLNQSLNLTVKYQPIFGGAFNVRRVDYTDSVALVVSKLAPMGNVYYFNQDAWLGALATNMPRLLERSPAEMGLRVEFDYPQPKCLDAYTQLFGKEVKFGQRYCQILFPRELIHQPLPGHCPAFLQRATQVCDRVLREMDTPTSLPEQVRSYLRSHLKQAPSMDDLARHLNLSVRTLNRRLALLDTNFRQLLKEVKLEVASEILFSSALPIGIVAERAGFSDASNFVKAFREWAGTTPNRYRKALKRQP